MSKAGLSEPIFHTGIANLDALFPRQGIPYGQLIEITGAVGCGKTSLLFMMMATLTKSGTVAYIDLSNSFFPTAAASCGVDIEKLSVVKPDNFVMGLRSAELLLSHQMVDSVVVDLTSTHPSTALRATGKPVSRATRAVETTTVSTNAVLINRMDAKSCRVGPSSPARRGGDPPPSTGLSSHLPAEIAAATRSARPRNDGFEDLFESGVGRPRPMPVLKANGRQANRLTAPEHGLTDSCFDSAQHEVKKNHPKRSDASQRNSSPSPTLLHRLRRQVARSKALVIFLTDYGSDSRQFLPASMVALRLEVSRLMTTKGSCSATSSQRAGSGLVSAKYCHPERSRGAPDKGATQGRTLREGNIMRSRINVTVTKSRISREGAHAEVLLNE